MYDYVIVGAGLAGSVFAEFMTRHGKRCIVLEQRDHIGGNCYDYNHNGYNIHKYGIHVFHTSNMRIWNYIRQFGTFNPFYLKALIYRYGAYYSSPMNMHTFAQLWGTYTPEEARERVAQSLENVPGDNVEAFALRTVGRELYETFIKEPIRKHWGTHPRALPASIIKRIPLRFTYDDNYYFDRIQAMPVSYAGMFGNLLRNVPVMLGVDFLADREYWTAKAGRVVFTGEIDKYFDYTHGKLPYRSLRFDIREYKTEHKYGAHMVRFADTSPAYRAIEWKLVHAPSAAHNGTVVTYETPEWYNGTNVPMYPVRTEDSTTQYEQYAALAENERGTIFIGRLARFQYLDMHQVIAMALKAAADALQEQP